MATAKDVVLLISSDFPPVSGGQSRYLYDLWSNLPASEVVILAPRLEGDGAVDAAVDCKVERRRLPLGEGRWQKIAKALLLWWAAWRLCRRYRVRQIHCGQIFSAGVAGWGCRLLAGVPYVLYAYGADLLEFRDRPLWGGLLRRILAGAARVVTISRFTAAALEASRVPQERIRLLMPAIDLSRFSGLPDRERLRQGRGWQHAEVILTVGRLVERKGQDTVIRALAEVAAARPQARYVIGGAGPYEKPLRDLARQQGVEGRVDFVGFVPEEELPGLLAAADVFAMVSRQRPEAGDVEGFGIVFLEANAAGTPVLGGRSGGVEDAVIDGRTGLLVDPQNVAAVAAALVQLLGDAALRRRLGEEGRQRVQDDFDRRRRAAELWEACR